MLNIAFVIHGEDIIDRYRKVEANTRLLRLLNSNCVIHLIIAGRAADIGVNVKLFNHIYEAKSNNEETYVTFLAKTLPLINVDSLLYLDENLFSFSPLHDAITRNLTSGVFISKDVLDFRGNIINTTLAWQDQQLMLKHSWPVINAKCIWFNRDQKSMSFFKALEEYSIAWESIGSEISDGAMKTPTLNNVLSFVCQTNDDEYSKTEILNYRHFGKRNYSRDSNWVNKDWYNWLDVWWVSRDMPQLRIENFRQQGLIYMEGDYIEKVEEWLEKINR